MPWWKKALKVVGKFLLFRLKEKLEEKTERRKKRRYPIRPSDR